MSDDPHVRNLNRLVTFVVGAVFIVGAFMFWFGYGGGLFASTVAPTPAEDGTVSVAASGQADFALGLINLLVSIVSGVGATVLTVLIGGVRLIVGMIRDWQGGDTPAPKPDTTHMGMTQHPPMYFNPRAQPGQPGYIPPNVPAHPGHPQHSEWYQATYGVPYPYPHASKKPPANVTSQNVKQAKATADAAKPAPGSQGKAAAEQRNVERMARLFVDAVKDRDVEGIIFVADKLAGEKWCTAAMAIDPGVVAHFVEAEQPKKPTTRGRKS